MSTEDLFEYIQGEYQTVTRMRQYPPGTGVVYIRDPNRVKMAGYDIEIWDAETGGTQLTANTDYTLGLVNADISALEGFPIYGGFQVLTPAYQSIDLYITAKIVGGYTTRPYATKYTKVTADVTVNTSVMDDSVLVDTAAGDVDVTLEDGEYDNQRFTAICTGVNSVYIIGTGIPTQAYNNAAVVFVWYSNSWFIVGGTGDANGGASLYLHEVDTDAGDVAVTLTPSPTLGDSFEVWNIGTSGNHVRVTTDGTTLFNGLTIGDGKGLRLRYVNGWKYEDVMIDDYTVADTLVTLVDHNVKKWSGGMMRILTTKTSAATDKTGTFPEAFTSLARIPIGGGGASQHSIQSYSITAVAMRTTNSAGSVSAGEMTAESVGRWKAGI